MQGGWKKSPRTSLDKFPVEFGVDCETIVHHRGSPRVERLYEETFAQYYLEDAILHEVLEREGPPLWWPTELRFFCEGPELSSPVAAQIVWVRWGEGKDLEEKLEVLVWR